MSRARRLGAVAAVAATLAGAPAAARAPTGAAAVAGGDTAGTLVSGAVRYVLPGRWVVQAGLVGCGSEGVAAAIPCPPLDATPHSADANLLALPNDAGESLAAWSARRLAVAAPRRVVDDRVEEVWRTVLSAGEDRGVRYAVVERFGATPVARVHAVAAFPLLPEVGERWLVRTGAEIGRFLASLRVEGAPPSRVHVEWSGGALRLRGGGGPTRTPTSIPTPTSTSTPTSTPTPTPTATSTSTATPTSTATATATSTSTSTPTSTST